MVELRNREREYAGSNTGAPKSFFQLKKRLPAPGNWRNMPFTGTVTGHDNWPISGRFWPVAWVINIEGIFLFKLLGLFEC